MSSFLFFFALYFSLSLGYFCKPLVENTPTTLSCWKNDDPSKQGIKMDDNLIVEDDLLYQVFLTSAANNYGALCLDGSTPDYYFREGTGDGISKWQIYFQGGGWCAGYEDSVATDMGTCASRAFSGSTLGTTNNDAPTLSEDSNYFSTDSTKNPLMYNWNTVYVRYCDGASFSGNVNNPINVTYKNEIKSMYFRGHRIITAVLDDILSSDNYTIPTEVMVTGSSAGGLAVYINVDYIIDYIQNYLISNNYPKLVNYGGMPDSGYFMKYESPSEEFVTGMEWIFNNQNISYQLNNNCLNENSNNYSYNCIFAQYMTPYTKTRIFPLQSQYDKYQIDSEIGNNNSIIVNEYGYNLTNSITNNVISMHSNNGLFLDSCEHHTYFGKWDTLYINGTNAANAIYLWYSSSNSNGDYVWFQNDTFPCPQCC